MNCPDKPTEHFKVFWKGKSEERIQHIWDSLAKANMIDLDRDFHQEWLDSRG